MSDYPSESNICLEVQSLEEIVDIIEKNNVNNEVEDDIVPLELDTCKETLIVPRILHNFMVQFEKTTPQIWMQ